MFKKIRQYIWKKVPQDNQRKLIILRHRLSLSKRNAEKSTDTFLISFPKCGRTWLIVMISRVMQCHFSLGDANAITLEELANHHPAIPRMLATHDDTPQFKKPEELETSKSKYRHKKVVFLVRDPRDVLVSSFFQKTKRKKVYDKQLSNYVYEAVGSFDSIIRYYNIWAANRHVPKQFLLVRYEDMRADPQKELRRVINFLGLADIPDNVIEEAVEYASFENMRQMEAADRFGSGRLRAKNPTDQESFKTRKGKVAGFRDYLSQTEIEHLNAKMEKELSDVYGYQP
jgi:hypothetical protein